MLIVNIHLIVWRTALFVNGRYHKGFNKPILEKQSQSNIYNVSACSISY